MRRDKHSKVSHDIVYYQKEQNFSLISTVFLAFVIVGFKLLHSFRKTI